MEPEDTSVAAHLKVWPAYTNLVENGSPELPIKSQTMQIKTIVHATYKFGYRTLFFEHPFILLNERTYYNLKWVASAVKECNQPVIANRIKEDENYAMRLASVVRVSLSLLYTFTNPS